MGGWRCPRCDGENVEGMGFCGWCGVAAGTERTDQDEQRLVTALFADISGFTTLADTLDTEELHYVISPVISVLAGIAEGYGGTVAKYAGDAVLVFFGAPVAQEDHAVRAALTALDMHKALAQAITRLGPDAQGLELHIGVNSGRVIAGMFGGDVRNDYSILGDSVNVAQRLESVAPPGDTYVGEITRQLIESDFELEPLGGLTLKGKTKPVDAWRLVGRLSARTAAPGATGSAFVGRDAELQAARDAIDGSIESGGILTLVAEPGGGKTRLTEEMRAYVASRAVRWLDARCISYGGSVAYYPFIELLRRAYGIAIEQDPAVSAQQLRDALLAQELGHLAPYFARVTGLPTPSGVDDISSLEPQAFRRGLHDAFATWLTTLLRAGPVVLALEDVHWIDTTSLDLAAQLAALTRDHPLLIVATARPEGTRSVELLTRGSQDWWTDIQLGPLDRRATASLIADALSGEPDARVVDMVLERTGGNPFFTHELVRSVYETGGLKLVDGVWRLSSEWSDAALPPTIEGVLAGRIDMLARPTAQVLQIASVIGKRVNHLLLEAVADDVSDLPRHIERLIVGGFLDRSIVDGAELLAFHHALVADVAYSRLVRRQRCELHRRVAEAAEALYGTGDDVIDLLARHFYLANAGVKAVDYLERAASRSERLFANEEAILHLRRAIELTRDNDRLTSRLPSLVLGLADLEELIGDDDEAERLFDEVRQQTRDVRAFRGLAAIRRRRGHYDESLAVIDEGVTVHADDGVAAAQLALERGWSLYQAGRQHESIEALRGGLALVGDSDDPIVGHLLLILARSEEHEAQFDTALEHARSAQERFEASGDIRGLVRALRQVGGVLFRMARHDEAAVTLRRGLALAERVGNAEELGACLINLGLVEEGRGAIDDAVACDRRAIEEFERTGNSPGRAIAYVNLADKLVKLDRFDEALHHCEVGLRGARQIGYRTTEAEALDTMATILLRIGRAADAVAAAEQASAIFDEMDAVLLSSRALQTMAEALEVIGERERARTVLVRAQSMSANVG